MAPNQVGLLLIELAGLYRRVGETSKAASFEELAALLSQDPEGDEYRTAVRTVLRMYGGMGSFSDEVLQDRTGVLPEHETFDALRGELFEAAVNELR
jgi:hypothetical protein